MGTMPQVTDADILGTIALVTGASRGAGAAIAVALGERGATVYATGRSVRGETTEGLPGSIEDTADAVTAAGGRGIAVRCDHADDAAVESLLQRIGEEHETLDVLVNNAWGGYEHHEHATFTVPLWEQPLSRWDAMFTRGVRAQLVTSRFAAPLLMRREASARPGLIVNTIAWVFGAYLGNLVYDVAKAASIRMAFGLGEELREHRVAAVALAPGFMRTERVLAAHAANPFDLSRTESPAYVGRAVAALASDPDVLTKTGQMLYAGELAREYGFTDADGTQPEPFRFS
jgi:NAD(P)-dependent dehydrogenase (short-subunit alcohol dehydrogenase family)